MKSPRDHLTDGIKNIGLDGGLDLKTDPIQVPNPATTTCDNVWLRTTGQVRSLPSPGTNLLPDATTQVYNATSGPQGGVFSIRETTLGAGASGPKASQPQFYNPAYPSAPCPSATYQANFRTKVLSNLNNGNAQFCAPDAPINGKWPYAQVGIVRKTGYIIGISFAFCAGDFITGVTAPFYTYQQSSSNINSFRVIAIPGDSVNFLLAYQTDGSNALTLRVMQYNSYNYAGGTPFTIASTAYGWTMFVAKQQVYIGYLTAASGGIPTFVQVGATGIIGTPATYTAVPSSSGYLSARYLNGVGLMYAYTTAVSVNVYANDEATWNTGTGKTPTVSLAAAVTGNFYAPSTTVGIAKNSVTGAITAAVFFMQYEAFASGSSPGLNGNGVGFYSRSQLGCLEIGGTATGSSFAGIAAYNTFYWRTAQGASLIGECFSPNYNGPGGTSGVSTSNDFLVPMVTGAFDNGATSIAEMFTQPRYYLLNAHMNVVGRWADDAAGLFVPSNAWPLPLCTPLLSPSDNASLEFYIPYNLFSQLKVVQPAPNDPSTATYFGAGMPAFNNKLDALAIFSIQAQNATCPMVYSGRTLSMGGPLTMFYDGQTVHEAGIVSPRNVFIGSTVTASSGITINTTSGSTAATYTVSGNTKIFVGMTLSGTGIASGTTVSQFDSNALTLTLSKAATATGSVALGTLCQYQYTVVYRWPDANGLVHRSPPSPVTQVSFVSGADSFGQCVVTFPIPETSYKYYGGQIEAVVYRTVNAGSQFFQVYSVLTSAPQQASLTGNLADFYISFTDTTADTALINPTGQNYIVEDRLYTAADGSYSAYQPPPFLWQVATGGRLYGLACVEGFYRVYFSQLWDEQAPPEFNYFCYLAIPAELGDVRSLAAYQSSIFLFGTRGIATFGGSGPARQLSLNSDGTTPNGATLSTIYTSGFYAVTPLPTPAGIRGCGSPVTTPVGVIYQDRAGFQVIDSSLNLTPVGAKVDALTGTLLSVYPSTVYGSGTLSESLSAVVFANPAGAALVWDYNTSKFSTWSAASGVSKFIQAVDKSLYCVTASTLQPINQFGSTMKLETPWLDCAPSGSILSPSNSNPGAEGNIYEMMLVGQYFNPHTLMVETAINYGPYKATPGYLSSFAVTTAPAQYQYRFRPPGGNRIWSIRYRITVTPPTGSTLELARISGLVLYCAIDSSVTRVGRGQSL